MSTPSKKQQDHSSPERGSGQPDQSPAENPDRRAPGQERDQNGRWPPDALPNPMPGVDPQQTPGIDRLGDANAADQEWLRSTRGL
ncbi:hypothetical protein ACNPPY_15365 [Achromobacter sp. AGC78]|jgi:hypothetical protein|uniref:Uncharacterized protein n=1 Tax=Achromobacter spanius TaxID=217203 RepID=A0AA42S7U7_9BURK|nr:hypothetical protein [Achromobacter spanius]MDH0739946.1 hypothetical protein [Achromobacter spanius]